MNKYPRHVDIDFADYAPDIKEPKAFYGLPQETRFCRSCVISNQRPNSALELSHTAKSKKSTINFDDEGVCDACRVAEEKYNQIDWNAREEALLELLDKYRRNDGSYDCLVPGSGGKDSFYAAHVLKYKYGMHPLTVTWAPHIYTDWGRRNHDAWINAGFDNYLMTPSGRSHRLLTRLSVENLLHPFQAFMIGQKALAPKMALLFDLPLVFYGENEAEYGNPRGDTGTAKRSAEFYAMSDPSSAYLGGVSVAELTSRFGVPAAELLPYMPADPAKLDEKGVEVNYLGYFLKWHPQSCYYYSVEHGGFQASPERTPGTYSKYNSIDDRIDDFHYYTTFIKFGIGRTTYDAAQEIRSRDITREEGIALIKRFDGEYPERFSEEIFEYLSLPASEFPEASKCFEQPIMDREYFEHLCNRFRSPHLWKFDEGEWQLRSRIWQQEQLGAGYRD